MSYRDDVPMPFCPKCKCGNVNVRTYGDNIEVECRNCGHEWKETEQ